MNLIGCTNEEQVEKICSFIALLCVNLEGLV